VFCHANWAESLGGISFPLLADFHPKGEVATAYGLYLADKGITDRATVIIDAGGIVRHASSVTPAGSRDIAELAALCEKVDKAHEGTLPTAEPAPGIAAGAKLYVKSSCGFSRAALLAVANLHLQDSVTIRNISDDPKAAEELKKLTGDETVPVLQLDTEVTAESTKIIGHLVTKVAGFWS